MNDVLSGESKPNEWKESRVVTVGTREEVRKRWAITDQLQL